MTTREHVARMRDAPIIISTGDKGGIGKSFVQRCLIHNFEAWGVRWKGFDGDGRNSHLVRFCSALAEVQPHILKVEADFDQLLDKIEKADPSTTILIDTPAGFGDLMVQRGQRLAGMAAHLGRRLFRLFALDEEDDVLMAMEREKSAFGMVDIIAVLNGRFGPREMFELWDSELPGGMPSFHDQLRQAGGLEIYLPRMPIQPRMAVRRLRVPFSEGRRIKGDLSWNEGVNFDEWLISMEKAFLPAREHILG